MQRRPKQTNYDRSIEAPDDDEGIESDTESETENDAYFDKVIFSKHMSRCYLSYRVINYILTILLIIIGLAFLRERYLRLQLMAMTIVNENPNVQTKQLYEQHISSNVVQCPPCIECGDTRDSAVAVADLPDMPADYEEILNDWKTRYDRLITQVQKFSKVLLLQKYGSSPYFIELDIQVDNNEHVKHGKLLIELPYSEQMPHTTYYFLSQVKLGFWNSCSFFINLGVIYLDEARGSQDYTSLSGMSCDVGKFSDNSIIDSEGIMEFLAFQEYHSDVRHEELTLGLSGRPGGRGFYFNAQNNTIAHQPRGVSIPGAPPLEGDPCIGRLITTTINPSVKLSLAAEEENGDKTFFKKLKQMEHQTTEGVTERLFQSISSFQQQVWIKSAIIKKMK